MIKSPLVKAFEANPVGFVVKPEGKYPIPSLLRSLISVTVTVVAPTVTSTKTLE